MKPEWFNIAYNTGRKEGIGIGMVIGIIITTIVFFAIFTLNNYL